ncbi:MAG: hypothetical protein KME54_01120 [Tolypothrix brevis GSE-NOS-MK-07-07A]|jgi:hypothetical protein|nr:hypothetical protein [Tolypothrix brevis GSE-NOS-MK-07-07A]
MKMRLISPGRLGFVRVAASLLVGLLSAASQRNGISYFYNLTIKVAANAESLPAQSGDLSLVLY